MADRRNAHELIKAAEGNNLTKLQDCLSRGTDVNIRRTRRGDTALVSAARKGHENMVRFLIGAGADVNMPGAGDHTALMWSTACGHVGVFQLLLDAGADVNAKDANECTVLMWAAERGRDDMVKTLLDPQYGTDINMMDVFGETALFRAAEKGFLNMAKSLLKAGAYADDIARDGVDAVWLARDNDHGEIARLLETWEEVGKKEHEYALKEAAFARETERMTKAVTRIRDKGKKAPHNPFRHKR